MSRRCRDESRSHWRVASYRLDHAALSTCPCALGRSYARAIRGTNNTCSGTAARVRNRRRRDASGLVSKPADDWIWTKYRGNMFKSATLPIGLLGRNLGDIERSGNLLCPVGDAIGNILLDETERGFLEN